MHNRSLYETAVINGFEVKRAFINNEASVNITSWKTFQQSGIPREKLVRKCIDILGFSRKNTRTIGYARLDMQVGMIKSSVTFHVPEFDALYHVLLGRAWQNVHAVMPSTYH